MPVPSAITDLSSTAASNSPAGSDPISTNLDDYLRAIQAILRAESLNKGWERYSHTVTWLSGTSFSVPGDLTGLYTVGRRLKATLAGPTTAYSTITGSSFGGGVTTVTVTNDSTALSSPISEVQLGLEIGSLLRSGAYLFDGAKATTQSADDDSDKLATTGFVQDVAATVGGVVGSVRNGRMSVTSAGVSATFTADEVIVSASLGGKVNRLGSFSQSINLSTTGAGGMDTGAAPNNGFVSIYAILKPDGTRGLVACDTSVSSGSVYSGANMPSGYIASALVGVWPTNGSGQFIAGLQIDRRVSFVPVTAYASNSGNPTTLTSLSLSSIVPPNARTVYGVAGSQTTTDGAAIVIAANSGGIGSQYIKSPSVSGLFDSWGANGPFALDLLTAQTLYWKNSGANSSSRIDINGYTF